MHVGTSIQLIRNHQSFFKAISFTFFIAIMIFCAYSHKDSTNVTTIGETSGYNKISPSDLTGATLTVATDKQWYKNNSVVFITGILQLSGAKKGYNITGEIYFGSETTPRYEFTAVTTANGSYSYDFNQPLTKNGGKEGNFTVWVNVLGNTNPKNKTLYYYDEHAPIVPITGYHGYTAALTTPTNQNPSFSWYASTDNNVSSANLTYSIYRAVKLVGQSPASSDYILLNNSVKVLTWTQTGALTSNRTYFYILSVRDIAGNAANYTALNATYIIFAPIISSILSPLGNGIYANSLNITAVIYDAISFSAWAYISNGSWNSSGKLSGYNIKISIPHTISNLYGKIWSIYTNMSGNYNVTFMARNSLNYLRIASPVLITVSKQAPIFSNIVNNNPDYTQNGTVTARIQDISGNTVDKVFLYYSIDNGLHFIRKPMQLSSGTVTDGTWSTIAGNNIPTFNYYNSTGGPRTVVYYKLWANNTGLRNINISSVYTYNVQDRTKPTILTASLIQTPSNATTVQFYRSVSVQINATEPTGLSSGVSLSIAYLYYRVGSGSWKTLTMSNRGGNIWNAMFQTFYSYQQIPAANYGSLITYIVGIEDQAGNWANSSVFSYTVQDNSPPSLVNTGFFTPEPPVNYNTTGQIWANFTDLYSNVSTLSSGIYGPSVHINYTYNTWAGNGNYVQMTESYGNSYNSSWKFVIPQQSYGTVVLYKFYIRDNNSNALWSSVFSYTVTDQYAPTYSGLAINPAIPTYQKTTNISIVPSDWSSSASGINYLRFQFVNTTGTQGWFTMTKTYSTYYYVMPKQNYGQTITYTIDIYDNAGNLKIVTGTPFFIKDLTAPNATIPAAPTVQYYQRLNITLTAWDTTSGDALPSGVKNVTFSYTVNLGTTNRTLMTLKTGNMYSGTYNIVLAYYNWNTNISYNIFVYDNAGNVLQYGPYGPVNIKDNLAPTYYTPVIANTPVQYSMQSNITIRLTKPSTPANSSGIGTVTLSYALNGSATYNSITCTKNAGTWNDGNWNALIPYQSYGTTVQYNFTIKDKASNKIMTSIYGPYTIIDLVPPTINSVTNSLTPMYYQSPNIQVNAIEPVTPAHASGVHYVFLNYSVNYGAYVSISMVLISGSIFNGIWNWSIPKQNYNSIVRYNVTAIDFAGNRQVSSTYSYTVQDNVKPAIGTPVVLDTNNLDGIIEYYENFNINVTVTKVNTPTLSSGVSTVVINYTVNGVIWNTQSSSKTTGDAFSGTWRCLFYSTQIAWNELFNYSVRATDSAGNVQVSQFYSFRIADMQKPAISVPKLVNAPGRYNIRANITVTVTKASTAASVKNVTIQYSTNSGVSWSNATSTTLANGTMYLGTWSALLPYINYGITVQVRCYARDLAGNSKTSTTTSYFVDDFVNPVVSQIQYNTDCQYWQNNWINITVLKDSTPALSSGVASIYLNYSINGTGNHYLAMTKISGTIYNGIWQCMIPKQNYATIVSFNYTVQDVKGNQVKPGSYTSITPYTVTDHVVPAYSNVVFDDSVNHNGIVQYYDVGILHITVSKITTPTYSSKIQSVTINRSIDFGKTWTVTAMTLQSGSAYSAVYNFTFTARDWNTTVEYAVYMRDIAGNVATYSNSYLVHDNRAPTITTPSIVNMPAVYYNRVNITVNVVEPTTPMKSSGVGVLHINYTTGSGWTYSLMQNGSGTMYNGYWWFQFPYFNYGTFVQYKINATDRAKNVLISSVYNFTIGDNIAPTVGTVVTKPTSSNCMYYLSTNINVTVTKPTTPAYASGVAIVNLIYSVAGVLQTPITMSRVSGNQYSGVYSATIAAQNYGSLVIYNFTATDVAGNSATNVQTGTYTPGDNIKPGMSNVVIIGGTVQYYQQAQIQVTLAEATTPALSSGIQTVTLQYTINNWGSRANVSMSQITGINRWAGTWNAYLPLLSWNTNVKFNITVYDSAGNKNTTAVYTFTIIDTVSPVLGTPALDNPPITYNKLINITINIQKASGSSGVLQATLNYSYYGNKWYQASMALQSGTTLNGNWKIYLPMYLAYGTTFKYTIIAKDNAGNSITSLLYSVFINDTTLPAVSIVQTDNGNHNGKIEYQEQCVLYITVNKAVLPNKSSGIASVQVYYNVNGSAFTSVSVYLQTNTVPGYQETWNASIYAQNYHATVQYYIVVTDNAENKNTSSYYSYTVQDLTPATFGTISSSNTNYNQNPTITTVVNKVSTPTNSSGVSLVLLSVYISGPSWLNLTMTRISGTKFAGTYSISLNKFAYGTIIQYKVYAIDFAANTGKSSQYSFTIGDNVQPTIAGFYQHLKNPSGPNYNDTQIIDVHITKALNSSGINATNIWLYYQNGTSTYQVQMTLLNGTTPSLDSWRRATIPATTKYNQMITYWVVAYDLAGNSITSSTYTFTVEDSFPVTLINAPVVSGTELPYGTIQYDENAIIKLNASEPVLASGINYIQVRWRNASIAWNNLQIVTMSLVSGNTYQGSLPIQKYGTSIKWYVLLVDKASNVLNYSTTTNITIADLKPPTFVSYSTVPTPVKASTQTLIKATFTEPAFASGLNKVTGSAFIYYNITGGGTNQKSNLLWNSSTSTFDFNMTGTTIFQTVSFSFGVHDLAGNFINTTVYSYVANDITQPSIPSVAYTNPVQYYQSLNVTITARDSGSGVSQVFLYYRLGNSGSWTQVSGSLSSGTIFSGTWKATIPQQKYTNVSLLYFYAYAIGGSGIVQNLSKTFPYNNTSIGDNLLPTISNILINGVSPASANIQFNQGANVTVNVYKSLYSSLSSNITTVILNYTISGTKWYKETMTRVSGNGHNGVWSYVIQPQIKYNTKVNFTITASDNANPSNKATSAITAYTITDHANPSFSNFVVTGTMYYNTINITIRLFKTSTNQSTIVSATLTYTINSVPNTGPMSKANGTYTNGYWSAIIGPYNYGTTVQISVNCLDQAGNALVSSATNATNDLFTVGDNIAPSIPAPSITRVPSGSVYYYNTVNVTVRILEVQTPTQSSGINPSTATLSYSTNGGTSWTTISMSVYGTFNKFNSSFTAILPGQNYGTNVQYKVQCDDQASPANLATSSVLSYTVGDNVAPTIVNFAKTATNVYYTTIVTVNANITKATTPELSSGVASAILHYKLSNSTTIYNVPMTLTSGTAYAATYTGNIPAQGYGITVTDWVEAIDVAGNHGLPGSNKTYTVGDNVPPTYTTISIANIEYNQTASINILALEPTMASGMKSATLNYSVANGAWQTIQIVAPLNGTIFSGWWSWSISPEPYNTVVRFTIILLDNANNQYVTALKSYTVIDTYAPVIGTPAASTPVYYNANGTVTVSVSERSNGVISYSASGVMQVMLNYSVNGTRMKTRSATLTSGDYWNGVWQITLPAFNWDATISYNITAVSNAGQRSSRIGLSFVINDSTSPAFAQQPFVIGRPIQYYQNTTITVQITDLNSTYGTRPSGVKQVRYYFSISNVLQPYLTLSLTSGSRYNGNWSVTTTMYDYNTVRNGYIWAIPRDLAGTSAISSNFTVTSLDNKSPVLYTPTRNSTTPMYYQNVNITVRVQDGVGDIKASSGISASSGVQIYWRIGTNPYTNAFMTRCNGTVHDGYYSSKIPMQPYSKTITYYIFATDIAGNVVNGSTNKVSYTVDDNVAPMLGTLSANNPQYNVQPLFTITVTEPANASGVKNVTLNYRINSGKVLHANATLISGNSYSGTWQATTSMFNYSSIVTYNFTARDVAHGNAAISSVGSFTVGDKTPPVLSALVYTTSVSYNVHPVIQLLVQDQNTSQSLSAGISKVNITYAPTHLTGNLFLSEIGGGNSHYGTWSVTLPEYFTWNSIVSFTIKANDSAGNVQTITGSFTIIDHDAPQIQSIQAIAPSGNGVYEYNQTIPIQTIVSDAPAYNTSSGIDFNSVYLYYRLSTSGAFSTKLMNRIPGAQYNQYYSLMNSSISSRPYGTVVQYMIGASDLAGNAYNSSVYSYTVGDSYAPAYSNPCINNQFPGSQPLYYYNTLIYTITVIEDAGASGVQSVQLSRSINGSSPTIVSLTLLSGTAYSGTWNYSGKARNSGTTVSFYFIVTDVAGNSRNTQSYSITILDNMKPVLSTVSISGSYVDYTMLPTISITATKDQTPAWSSGLKQATIKYNFNGSSSIAATMSPGAGSNFNRTYSFQIPYKLAYGWSVSFTINVTDNAGNWQTATSSYIVQDHTPASITGVSLLDNHNNDGYYEYYETLSLQLFASKDKNSSGISQVFLNYSVNSGLPTSVSMTETSGTRLNGTWIYTLGTFVYGTVLKYNVTVVDKAGNRKTSLSLSYPIMNPVPPVTITDLGKPQFSLPLANNKTTLNYLDTIYMQINITKPLNSAKIKTVTVTYTINGSSSITKTATNFRNYTAGYNEAWQYILSRQSANTSITFYFTATDYAGNVNSSTVRARTVVDTTPPQLMAIYLNGQINPLTWTVSYSSTLNVTVMLNQTSGGTPNVNGSGISVVYLHYRSGGTAANYITVNMTRVSGNIMAGTWYYLVPALPWNVTVYLEVEVHDRTKPSNNLLQTYTIVQTDMTPPAISGVTILTLSTYPQYYDVSQPPSFYTVSINATLTTPVSSSGVNLAKTFVQFKLTNQTAWINASLSYTGKGSNYTATIYGMKWRQVINYRIYAQNNYGAYAINSTHRGISYSYYAKDSLPPTRLTDTIGSIIQDAQVLVSIKLSEPANASGMNDSTVFVNFWHAGIAAKKTLLSNDGTGTYNGYIDANPYPTFVQYYFTYADKAGNPGRYPATSNYTYTIGDNLLPIYNDSATVANLPGGKNTFNWPYMTTFSFSVYCWDAESSIGAITISYTIGTGSAQYMSNFVKIPGATKQQDQYNFLIPGAPWASHTIEFYVVNLTATSGPILNVQSSSTRIFMTITDQVKPSLNNASIQIINGYQTRFNNNPIILNFTASKATGSSGLANVSVIYTNSTNLHKFYTISSINPTGTQFSFLIKGQMPFTNVTYYFWIKDNAGNMLNTQATNRTFKVDYYETRSVNQTFTTQLVNPVTSAPIESFKFNSTQSLTIRITEYDTNPESIGAESSNYVLIGKVYKVTFNVAGAYLSNTSLSYFALNFSMPYMTTHSIDTTTLAIAHYTPYGYTALTDVVYTSNGTIVISNNYQLRTLWLTASQYMEYFVILGKYIVPTPSVTAPSLTDGMTLYGKVVFHLHTQAFAKNISAYYKLFGVGNYVLIGWNTSQGNDFQISWNTTALGNKNNVQFMFIAYNAQGQNGTLGINQDPLTQIYVNIHNIPDSTCTTLTLPNGTTYSGTITLSVTTTIPASKATFFYIYNSHNYAITPSNTSKPSWNGYYPFTGSCTFSITWDSTYVGNLNYVQFGVNLTSYYVPGQVGTTNSSRIVSLINIPNPTITANISQYENVYGMRSMTTTTTYRGVKATFYIIYGTSSITRIIGTNTSANGGYTFIFLWNTTSIAQMNYVYLHVNITNSAGVNGTAYLTTSGNPTLFQIVNVPVIEQDINYLPQTITGIQALTVIVNQNPTPTKVLYYIFPLGSTIPLSITTVTSMTTINLGTSTAPQWYDQFTYSWDSRYLQDQFLTLKVRVFNHWYVVNGTNVVVQTLNIPKPSFTVIGPYTAGNVAFKTLNQTIMINVTSTNGVYSARTEIWLWYYNGTYKRLTGIITSPDSNVSISFYWQSWLLNDSQNVRLEVRMFNLGGWSNLNSSTGAIFSQYFNMMNLPQPVITNPPVSNADLYGDITVQAYTPLNASWAMFYYHNSTGTYQFNGAGNVTSVDHKHFSITWHTAVLPEMVNINMFVVMSSMGKFVNKSVNYPKGSTFNLRNIPYVSFAGIDQVSGSPGVISGSTVHITLQSPNLAHNVTLYCILNYTGQLFKIGFGLVSFGGSIYSATLTWDSLSFTKQVLSSINPSWYDFNVTFRADMTNLVGRNGTAFSGSYSIFNAPAITTDLQTHIANGVMINMTNTRSLYISVASVQVSFYNGSQHVSLTMLGPSGNRYYKLYDFSSFLPNASAKFTFQVTTSTGIAYLHTLTGYNINNTPTPVLIENFSVAWRGWPSYLTVISGNTTLWATSIVQFNRAQFFVVLPNGTRYSIGNNTNVVTVNNHFYRVSLIFNSVIFERNHALPGDVDYIYVMVSLYNYRGTCANATSIKSYDIINTPSVLVTAPTLFSGIMNITANNTWPFINITHAYLITWNGIYYEQTNMSYSKTLGMFVVSWDSRFASDTSSFVFNITMTSYAGLSGTGSSSKVNIFNDITFITFLQANTIYHFDLTTGTTGIVTWANTTYRFILTPGMASLNLAFTIIVSRDAYFKINVTGTSGMPSVNIPTGYYVFSPAYVLNATLFELTGNNIVKFNGTVAMNVKFKFSFTDLQSFRINKVGLLNESSVTLLAYDEGKWSSITGYVNSTDNSLTVNNLAEFSIFVIAAMEQQSKNTPSPDLLSMFVLIACIVAVLSVVSIATRPKVEKEQIVPGKKKTCKQCGKYVKPYAVTCPYCGFRLAEEETLTDAMNKLRHLFIFHEDSGVCLYYHPFTDSKIDPQLISGFLSAITSFGGQFEDATTKKKAMKEGAPPGKATSDLKELVYKEYRILMETSGPCKFAVLITGQASKILSFKISQFIKHFMRTYDEALKDWKGNVRIFKDVEKMVRLIFGLTKVQPEGGKPAAHAETPRAEGVAPAPEQKPQKPEKSSAPAPVKPVPPSTPQINPPSAEQPGATEEKGRKPKAASLFALKEQIGVPGEFTPPAPKTEKPAEKPAKNVFSPNLPPEMEKKGKKKKKQ